MNIDLRHEREARGLSLRQVAKNARIPEKYLQALEDGDHSVLPPGPFLQGYRQQYLEFLGLDEEDFLPTEIAPKPEAPLWRLVMMGFAGTLLVVGVIQLGVWAIQRPGPSDPVAAMDPQLVRVRAIEPTTLVVRMDDAPAEKIRLGAGETHEAQSAADIELIALDLTRVTLSYNGERLEPLGNLSEPRTLVFTRDAVE